MKIQMFLLKAAMLAWFISGIYFIKMDAALLGAISFLVAAYFGHLIIKPGKKSVKSK